MLVSGVFSSCAARERKRSLRDSRSAAASTRGGRGVSNGPQGRRSRTPLRTGERGADHVLLEAERTAAGVLAPLHATGLDAQGSERPASRARRRNPASASPRPCAGGLPTPAAPDSRRAILAILPGKLARWFLARPAAASASCVARGGEKCALERRWSEKTPERSESAELQGLVERPAATGSRPSGETRGEFRCAPAATRPPGAREPGAGRRRRPPPTETSNGCTLPCRREVQARATLELGTTRPNLSMPDRRETGKKRCESALAGRHSACKGPAEGPLPDLLRGRVPRQLHWGCGSLHASGRLGTRPPGDAGGGPQERRWVAGAGRFARIAGPGAHWAPSCADRRPPAMTRRPGTGEYAWRRSTSRTSRSAMAWMLTLSWDLSQVIFARERRSSRSRTSNLGPRPADAADRAASSGSNGGRRRRWD